MPEMSKQRIFRSLKNSRFFNWELIRTYKLAAKIAIDILNNNSSSCNDTDDLDVNEQQSSPLPCQPPYNRRY